MIILGVDPGYRNLGWGVIEFNGETKLRDHGVLLSKKSDSEASIYGNIYKTLRDIALKHSVTHIIIELPSPKTHHKVQYTMGIFYILEELLSLSLHLYTPKQIKKVVTGNYKADKQEVARHVIRYISNTHINSFNTDHESDAVAIGLTYILSNSLDIDNIYC